MCSMDLSFKYDLVTYKYKYLLIEMFFLEQDMSKSISLHVK